MGSVVGEKFSRAAESAIEGRVPLISITASGGARMQEGILSRRCSFRRRFAPWRTCVTPAAGSSASWPIRPRRVSWRASQASATSVWRSRVRGSAFTGPRVVQGTTREKLPEDFGLAESNFRYGHVDAIVPRPELRGFLREFCASSHMPGEAELRLRERLSRLRSLPLLRGPRLSGQLERLQRQLERIQEGATDEEVWKFVELARHDDRPYTLDYVERLLEDFVELHGDRARAEDPALVTGLGELRRSHGRRDRAPEGSRRGRAGEAALRDGLSRGVPGAHTADDGDRRALRDE